MTAIHCDDPTCRLPSARIINGALVIESQHYGKKHYCTLSLTWLKDLLTNESQSGVPCAVTTVSAPKPAPP
jgi:hypothetical protein